MQKKRTKSVISVINNESYSSFANDLGIDVIINPRELTTSRIIEKISKGSLYLIIQFKEKYIIYEIKYKNEIYENIKKSEVINQCTLTNESLELKNDDHIPLNNDILILCVSQKDSHVLEKIINDD